MATVRFNRINIQTRLNNAVKNQRRFRGLAYNAANTRFQAAKIAAINEFNNHPVTQELSDESGESSILGRGNLFSFLGFIAGYNPIANLKEILFSNIKMNMERIPIVRQNKNSIVFEYRVTAPKLNDIYNETTNDAGVVEWTSKSWVELIEKGIPNFASYLYSKTLFGNKSSSRSKQAIQRKDGGGGRIFGISYVKKVLEVFYSYFRNK